jgi:hypothetical protein
VSAPRGRLRARIDERCRHKKTVGRRLRAPQPLLPPLRSSLSPRTPCCSALSETAIVRARARNRALAPRADDNNALNARRSWPFPVTPKSAPGWASARACDARHRYAAGAQLATPWPSRGRALTESVGVGKARGAARARICVFLARIACQSAAPLLL